MEVLFPYLNGEDLNSRPDCSASRWVIDFGLREFRGVETYRLPFSRVVERVKPQRESVKVDYRRKYWWRFAAWAPSMRKAIADLDEALVIALVSKTAMPARVPTGQVFSHKLAVFATDRFTDQAVLSSSLHLMWVMRYSSTMRTDLNYSPSDVFETFPRPEPTAELEAIGRTLDAERREIMLRRDLGLTRLYNLVNDPGLKAGADPDGDRMRAIHVELDAAVAAAYGWEDLDLTHGFHTYRKMTRWTVPPATRVEILDRLLEENHRRAAAEPAAASAAGRSTDGSRSRRGRKSANSVQAQEATLDI